MDRIIEVKVCGNHLSKDNKNVGVRGEANVTKLRITFDEGWDGYAKKVTFLDSHGANPVEIPLTPNDLEDISIGSVYLVPIPAEPLAEAGLMAFVIDGYLDGKRQRSIADKLVVKDAPIVSDAGEPVMPTPTEIEKIQQDIDGMTIAIQGAMEAKEEIENMSVSSETLATDEEAFVKKTEQEGSINLHFGLPRGPAGDSGVYIGAEEPTDKDVRVWIDPSNHDTLDEVMGILDNLRYTDGGVEVDLSDYLKAGEAADKLGLSDYLKAGEAADKLGLSDYVKEENANNHVHDAADIETGAVSIEHGGHGGTTVEEARENLGLANAAKVVYGSYTGNELLGRFISIGGNLQALLIAEGGEVEENYTGELYFNGGLYFVARAANADGFVRMGINGLGSIIMRPNILLRDDGIVVYDDPCNLFGITYTYIAFLN